MSLNTDDFNRYTQQLKLHEIGITGQLKLKKARVLCIGAGGLGSPLLLYLAAAGIGTIGIVDHDDVQLSNLHRQVLYKTADIGLKKATIAQERLLDLNLMIHVNAYHERLTPDNATQFIADYDIIADCTDNFDTHYLINDVCFELDKPYVFAAINQFEGQCSLFLGKKSPCYRCLFPSKPAPAMIPNCQEGGVLGVLPGIFGLIQANEIIKKILNLTETLAGKILTIHILTLQFRQFTLTKDAQCSLCGDFQNRK